MIFRSSETGAHYLIVEVRHGPGGELEAVRARRYNPSATDWNELLGTNRAYLPWRRPAHFELVGTRPELLEDFPPY